MNNGAKLLSIRPRARLMTVLGADMIGDQAVGLIELVKNSYDADATEVLVELLNLNDPEETTVSVIDNGCGMTLEDVENKWLSPAVAHKEHAKRAHRKSPMGRLPIGEKGVGRFAIHQIGRRFEMVTRAKNQPEYVVEIDWDRFDGEDYLDDIKVVVSERQPTVFQGEATGTKLVMRTARNPWSETLLKKIQRTFRRLQNPLPAERANFTVTLHCPEYSEYENVDPADMFDKAHYEFRALVMADGRCDFEYVCRHPQVKARSESKQLDLASHTRLASGSPACGEFYMNLYVWDRTATYLSQSGVTRQELDAYCGVSLYRDRLRVLPYGEPGDDWLFLDQDRIQAPAEKIGNNQVIGMVMVDQSSNLLLRDKTNREGLIENQAFLDLRAMTRAAIILFTGYWKNDRPFPSDRPRPQPTSIETARATAAAIRSTARDDVRVTLPRPPAQADVIPVAPPSDTPAPGASTSTAKETVVSQREAVNILVGELEGVRQASDDRERQLRILLDLAATGMAAERVVHEFGRQVAAGVSALADLKNMVSGQAGVLQRLSLVEVSLQTLRNEFRVLTPYEYIKRAERTREISVKRVVDLALALNKEALGEAGVTYQVAGDDFVVKGREGAVVQVADNLVHNAAHWLSTMPDATERRLALVLVPDTKVLLVADSGPGVHKEIIPQLGQPFTTMREGGRGLGLYISMELMKGMGGRIRLVDRSTEPHIPLWANGAVFSLEFEAQDPIAGAHVQ